MAIDPVIWQDLHTRLRNLRADMVGQWQGDIDNRGIEHTISLIGNAIQMWETAKPTVVQQEPPRP